MELHLNLHPCFNFFLWAMELHINLHLWSLLSLVEAWSCISICTHVSASSFFGPWSCISICTYGPFSLWLKLGAAYQSAPLFQPLLSSLGETELHMNLHLCLPGVLLSPPPPLDPMSSYALLMAGSPSLLGGMPSFSASLG